MRLGHLFAKRKGAIILLYHRVDTVNKDPHLLSVEPSNFREQLIAISKLMPPTSIEQIVKDISRGRNPRGFAVTFDDGYVDNLREALPILTELKIPASVYMTSSVINYNGVFPWNDKVPQRDAGRAMTKEELIELDSSSFIEIGSHAVSHPHLGLLPQAKQREELVKSKQTLEEVLGHTVDGFAYPFGAGDADFTKTTERIAAKAGYTYALANIPSITLKDSNLYALPRSLVRNWSADEMLENLKQYLPL